MLWGINSHDLAVKHMDQMTPGRKAKQASMKSNNRNSLWDDLALCQTLLDLLSHCDGEQIENVGFSELSWLFVREEKGGHVQW